MMKEKEKNRSAKENITEKELVADEVKKPKKKLPGWVIVPILLTLFLLFYAASKLFGDQNKIAKLHTVKVEKGDIKEVYNTSGSVESEKTKVYYSPVNAPILTCHAKAGQAVKAGDILVTYDTKNLERDNKQSEFNALSARYTNQDTLEQSSKAAKGAAQAEAQAENAAQSIKSQIAKKEAEIKDLEKIVESVKREAQVNSTKAAELKKQLNANKDQQTKKMADKANKELELQGKEEGIPEYNSLLKEIQQLTTELSNLEIAQRSLEDQLNGIGNVDTSEAEQTLSAERLELDRLKNSLTELANNNTSVTDTGITGAQLKNMQISENLAELAQLNTEELLQKGKEGMKAEFDGIISDVKAVEGSDAVQGGELFTIVSNQNVVVKLEVPANDFDQLVEGNKATVKIGKNTYHGTLISLDKIALVNEKGNPVIGAQIRIDNPDDNIFIGVNAKVSMTVAEKKQVLCLPNEVVNTSTEGDFVYIIQNGTVKKQMVELGVASSSKVEIADGLEEGSEVVSDVTGDITEGMKATAVLEDNSAKKE